MSQVKNIRAKKNAPKNKRLPYKKQNAQKPVKKQKKNVKQETVVYALQENKFTTQLSVSCPWNSLIINEMQAALVGYFLSRGIATNPVVDLNMFYGGMLYQWSEFVRGIGGAQTLSKRLLIINDLSHAFSPKSIPYHKFSKISYAWTGLDPNVTSLYSTSWTQWNFVRPLQDNLNYNAPCEVIIPTDTSVTAYNQYLSYVQGISSDRAMLLRTVSDGEKSVLERDASAFARVYSYNGLQGSGSGGYGNSVELETRITAPILSHNIPYLPDQQDERIPQEFQLGAGGPSFNLAPLLQDFNSWFNKSHVVTKFIDIAEIVNQLLYWYASVVESAVQAGDITPSDARLPFSYQDFTLIVRQALLAGVFKDQWMVQFMGPLAWNTKGTNFAPFSIIGNCYGNDRYKTLVVPTLLSESLSVLTTQYLEGYAPKSSINKTFYVPCLGYYEGDIQPEFEFKTPEGVVSLFLVGPSDQDPIRLTDCTIGSIYVNVNSEYYGKVLAIWNKKVTAIKERTNVASISNMSPMHNCTMLQATRLIKTIPVIDDPVEDTSLLAGYEYPALQYIKNLQYKMERVVDAVVKKEESKTLKKQPSKVNVKLPAPASVASLTIENFITSFPFTKEMYDLTWWLVLPSVRLDPNANLDKLNLNMYAMITGETLQAPQDPQSAEPTFIGRQLDAAEMCIQGKGKITSSYIDDVLKSLATTGKGGFLAGILGGVVKQWVPAASGLIDAVASSVPF